MAPSPICQSLQLFTRGLGMGRSSDYLLDLIVIYQTGQTVRAEQQPFIGQSTTTGKAGGG